MTERNFTGKNGDVWTWEETPETIEALKQLHKAVNETTLKRLNEYKATDS